MSELERWKQVQNRDTFLIENVPSQTSEILDSVFSKTEGDYDLFQKRTLILVHVIQGCKMTGTTTSRIMKQTGNGELDQSILPSVKREKKGLKTPGWMMVYKT